MALLQRFRARVGEGMIMGHEFPKESINEHQTKVTVGTSIRDCYRNSSGLGTRQRCSLARARQLLHSGERDCNSLHMRPDWNRSYVRLKWDCVTCIFPPLRYYPRDVTSLRAHVGPPRFDLAARVVFLIDIERNQSANPCVLQLL